MPGTDSLSSLPISLSAEDLELAITGGFASVNERLTPGLMRSASGLRFLARDAEGNEVEVEVTSVKFTVDPTFRAKRKPKTTAPAATAVESAATEQSAA